jgi:hypothetical protein
MNGEQIYNLICGAIIVSAVIILIGHLILNQ